MKSRGAPDDLDVGTEGESLAAFGERFFFESDKSGKFGMAENNSVDDKIDDANDDVTGCSDDVDTDFEDGTRDKGVGDEVSSSILSFEMAAEFSLWYA